MSDNKDARIVSKVDPSKRRLVRHVIKGTAFVVPVVASFSMNSLTIGGIRPAYAGHPSMS